MRWGKNISWDNVLPISDEAQVNALRTYNAIDVCFNAPAWAGFGPAEDKLKTVTITCGRCGKSHSYKAISSSGGRRRFCDACVRC